MPYIRVDTNKLKNYSSEIASLESRVRNIKQEFSSTANALDWDIKSASNIRSKTDKITRELGTEVSSLNKMENFLSNTARKYAELDGDNKPNVKDVVASATRIIAEKINAWKDDDTYEATIMPVEGEVAHAVGTVVEKLELTTDETDQIITKIAQAEGVPKETFLEKLVSGLKTTKQAVKWTGNAAKLVGGISSGLGWLSGKLVGATGIQFALKNGNVIVSGYTQGGLLNGLTKIFHGSGIGGKYSPAGLSKTPVIGNIYNTSKFSQAASKFGKTVSNVGKTVSKIAFGIEVAASVGTGVLKVSDGVNKISDIIADNSKTTGEKVRDVAVVGATTAVGTALNVAAPFVGKATQAAVTAAIPIPGLNVVAGVVAGVAVKGVMNVAADVITSEAVVNTVSNAVDEVGSAVTSGVKAVSEAGKALLESKTAGDAVANTAKLVGTAVVAGVNTAAKVVTESVKVATTVVAETAKTVVNKVVDTGKKVVETGKKVVNWFKSW